MSEAEKLKICMLGLTRIPSREGGLKLCGRTFYKNDDSGRDVTCYNRDGHHLSGKVFDQKKIKENKGIYKVFTINFKRLTAKSPYVFGKIRAAFGNYNVVHFHAEVPCAMLCLPKLL